MVADSLDDRGFFFWRLQYHQLQKELHYQKDIGQTSLEERCIGLVGRPVRIKDVPQRTELS